MVARGFKENRGSSLPAFGTGQCGGKGSAVGSRCRNALRLAGHQGILDLSGGQVKFASLFLVDEIELVGRVPRGGVGTVDPRQDQVQVRLPVLAS